MSEKCNLPALSQSKSRQGLQQDGNLLLLFDQTPAFDRTPCKTQVLHIEYWYSDGTTDQLNITSPHVKNGEDIESQYAYMKKYLQDMAPRVGIIAFRGHVCHVKPDGSLAKVISFFKVEVSNLERVKPVEFA